ncbi:hypothetical protein HanPSC8_Chr10g0435741 [Helianthus annuus]|nr:hypothetical protein HanPSC8_Chr10g0435741 [Helianthus annuus]
MSYVSRRPFMQLSNSPKNLTNLVCYLPYDNCILHLFHCHKQENHCLLRDQQSSSHLCDL